MTDDIDERLDDLAGAAEEFLAAKTRPTRIERGREVSRASSRLWRAVRGDAETFETGLTAKPAKKATGKEK